MKYHKTLTKSVEILSAQRRPSKSCKFIVSAETASPKQLQDQLQERPKRPLIETEPSVITMSYSNFVQFPHDVRTSWPTTRANQIVNILYFGSSATFFLWRSIHNGGLFLSAGALAFLLITALSCLFLLRHRSFVSTNDELPTLSRNLLRIFALSLPITMLCAAALIPTNDTRQDNYRLSSMQSKSFRNDPVIPPGPKNQEALSVEIKLADQLFDKNDFLDALVHYEKALENYPRSEHALVKAAECYYSCYPDRREKTIEYATQALNLDSNNTDALLCLAVSYSDLKRYDTALSFADSLISLEPGFGDGWAAMSKAKLGLGLFQGALLAANEHVRLHPNEYDAFYERAQVLKAMGRTREAQDDLERLKAL